MDTSEDPGKAPSPSPAGAEKRRTADGAKISAAELERLAREEVPVAGQMGVIIDRVAPGEVDARVPYREIFTRPGGTVAGPVLMALADFVMWGVVMSLIGPVKLAVTTSLNINFLRRPDPGDIVAKGRMLKLGRRLAVGEVYLYTRGREELVAHVTCTYSIPPRQGGDPAPPPGDGETS